MLNALGLTETFKMKVTSLYKFGLLLLFPFFFALHGIYWINNLDSLVLAVYALKLAFLPFLVFAATYNFSQILNERYFLSFVLIASPCFILSIISPFISGKGFNFFFFTDAIGLAYTFLSILVTYAILKNRTLPLKLVEKVSTYYVVIMSACIIVYYFLSGGMKISITPETQIPLAIAFGAYFFPTRNSYRPPEWVFVVAAIAGFTSQLRESLVVFLLLATFCLMRKLLGSTWIKILAAGAGLAMVALLVAFYFSGLSNIGESIAYLHIDGSVMQRFVEVDLVFKEMQKTPLSFILGQGFGATYENIDDQLIQYGTQVHNVHSTPAAVYFRNGIYGLTLYFSVLICVCVTIFSRDSFVFRTSLVLMIMYATLFFNQYLYWNLQFGLAVAMWIYSLHHRKSIK